MVNNNLSCNGIINRAFGAADSRALLEYNRTRLASLNRASRVCDCLVVVGLFGINLKNMGGLNEYE